MDDQLRYAQFKVTEQNPTDNNSATIVLQPCFDTLVAGKCYRVKLDLLASEDVVSGNALALRFGSDGKGALYHSEGVYGQELAAGRTTTVEHTFVAVSGTDNLQVTIQCGALKADTLLTVSNLRVEETNAAIGDTVNGAISYSNEFFGLNDGYQRGTLGFEDNAAVLTCVDTECDWGFLNLFVKSGANVTAGKYYGIRFTAQTDANAFDYNLHCNYREKTGDSQFYRNDNGIAPAALPLILNPPRGVMRTPARATPQKRLSAMLAGRPRAAQC